MRKLCKFVRKKIDVHYLFSNIQLYPTPAAARGGSRIFQGKGANFEGMSVESTVSKTAGLEKFKLDTV